MKQASETGDISEDVTAPQVRGWFQPPSRPSAISGEDPADDDTRPPPTSSDSRPAVSTPQAEVDDPDDAGTDRRLAPPLRRSRSTVRKPKPG